MKKASKLKALYQINRHHRVKEQQSNKNADDSLQSILSPSRKSKHIEPSAHVKPTPGKKINKKPSHIRSQSCPFTTPTAVRTQKNQTKKVVHQEERNQKTILKKTLNKPTTYVGKKSQQRHTNSQVSQDSNTVIVHSIPLEQLSSMLYSKNLNKQPCLKKSESSLHLPTSISHSSIFERIHSQTDVYFETKIQQQIKIYDLSQDLFNVQKQSQHVKVKQSVLNSLIDDFQQ